MEQARTRVLELLHYHHHRLAYKKRIEIVVEMVAQLQQAATLVPGADLESLRTYEFLIVAHKNIVAV